MVTVSAIAGSAVSAVSAVGDRGGPDRHGGDHNGRTLFDTTLAPSIPSDPMIHGVMAGGAPWVIRHGDARLRADGRLSVRIRGLVIPVAPGNGTPGPVMTVSASLYCGADTTAAVATTASVPISRAGDARIDGRLALPAKCEAAALLIQPNGIDSIYIASSGFGG